MIAPKILASGKFSPEDMEVSVSKSNRKIDAHVEGQLDACWEAKLKEAKARGATCYNGISYRLNGLEQQEVKLMLDFTTMDFKTRECLIEASGYFDLPPEYGRNGCYTLATVRTSDGKYVMVSLSGRSMNMNAVDFLGGIMEADIGMRTGDDVFRSLYKELAEEGLMEEKDVEEVFLKMVYLNPKTNVGFYFEVILSIASDVLLKRFDEQSKDQDINSLIFFSRPEYGEVLKKHNSNKQFIAAVVGI